MSTLYSFSDSHYSTTEYEARNTVAKALIDDMAAASISGWTYVSSTSPAVSTSAFQVFDVVFSVAAGYRIRFYTSASSSYKARLFFDLQTSVGGTIINAFYLTGFLSVGSYTYSTDIIISNYASASKYNINTIYVAGGSVYAWGASYLTDKQFGAPDFVISYTGASGTAYDVSGNACAVICISAQTTTADNKYCISDVAVKKGYYYTGKLIDTISPGGNIGSSFASYSVDGITYYGWGGNNLFTKV